MNASIRGLLAGFGPLVGLMTAVVLGTRVSWGTAQYPVIPVLGLVGVGGFVAAGLSMIVTWLSGGDRLFVEVARPCAGLAALSTIAAVFLVACL